MAKEQIIRLADGSTRRETILSEGTTFTDAKVRVECRIGNCRRKRWRRCQGDY